MIPALLLGVQGVASAEAQAPPRGPDFEIRFPKPTLRQNLQCDLRLEILELNSALLDEALYPEVKARARVREKLAAIEMFIEKRRLPPLAALAGRLALDRAADPQAGQLRTDKSSPGTAASLKTINAYASDAAIIIRAFIEGDLSRALKTANAMNSEMNRVCVD